MFLPFVVCSDGECLGRTWSSSRNSRQDNSSSSEGKKFLWPRTLRIFSCVNRHSGSSPGHSFRFPLLQLRIFHNQELQQLLWKNLPQSRTTLSSYNRNTNKSCPPSVPPWRPNSNRVGVRQFLSNPPIPMSSHPHVLPPPHPHTLPSPYPLIPISSHFNATATYVFQNWDDSCGIGVVLYVCSSVGSECFSYDVYSDGECLGRTSSSRNRQDSSSSSKC